MPIDDDQIRACILEALSARDAQASACPSEIARRLAADEAGWRALMPAVRRVALELAAGGRLRITQGERILEGEDLPRGPIRLRRGPAFEG
ncbi:DUF3253 domain-containing protein [Pseudomonas sp. RIT-PI-AD]|uniref:DUF3253 domain-containing protein n=1 Tax=Pseudomonas sp. RIT-PI-AD TaxID=3035294 RepID=UPI0021DB355F|nr:DUF3253 domain-containing protein [Pseudomonas sp. RIT-PI-AD]